MATTLPGRRLFGPLQLLVEAIELSDIVVTNRGWRSRRCEAGEVLRGWIRGVMLAGIKAVRRWFAWTEIRSWVGRCGYRWSWQRRGGFTMAMSERATPSRNRGDRGVKVRFVPLVSTRRRKGVREERR